MGAWWCWGIRWAAWSGWLWPAVDSGYRVDAVIGLGIKASWSREELDRAQALAGRPSTAFASRAEAAARFLRVSGLTGLVPQDDPAVAAGLAERDGQWWLTLDQRAFAVGAPDLAKLIADARADARADVTLARGERDTMNTDEEFARFGVPVKTLAGLGHNAHVEDPVATATGLLELRVE